jgi:hypothetical protein
MLRLPLVYIAVSWAVPMSRRLSTSDTILFVIMREIGGQKRALSRVSQESVGVYRAGAFDSRELDQIRLNGLRDIHGPHP